MQLNSHRIALPLSAGVVLAVVTTWVLGWFAAIALPTQAVRTIAQSPVMAFLVFSFAMNILPALAIGFCAGAVLGARRQTSRLTLVVLASLPWFAYATLGSAFFFPLAAEINLAQRLAPLLSWQIWLPVLAVPAGLWLGATLIKPSWPGAASGAAGAA